MREFEKHYSHAEIVNRRARFAILLTLMALAALIILANVSDGDSSVVAAQTPPISTAPTSTAPTTPVITVLAAGTLEATTTTLPPTTLTTLPPTTATTTTTTLPTTTTTAPTATTRAPTPPTTVRRTTTTTRPPTTTTTTLPPTTTTTTTTTTTLPPTTTTTTTTLPPTTTTTTLPPTTTTTLPPTTTTTTTLPPTTTTTTTAPPPNAWFPTLDADVSCDDDDVIVTWFVYDPADDWSSGWQMVIDSNNRGVFSPGTIVTSQGGPAVASEEVDPGSHTLTIDVHWERLPQGDRDRQFGTFSITAAADLECED